MSYAPTWSRYSLPGRGKLVLLDIDLVEVLNNELANNEVLEVLEALVGSDMEDAAISAPWSDDQDDAISDAGSDDISEYKPSSLVQTTLDQYFSPRKLRPRVPPSPCPSPAIIVSPSPSPPPGGIAACPIVPCPDLFTGSHMKAMGFRRIKWDDPQAFVDLKDRIGAVFVGPLVQRTEWERTVVQATNDMSDARRFFQGTETDDTLRVGITYKANGRSRPETIPNSEEDCMTLAALRYSSAIQEVASFQNAMLKLIAPRLWATANKTIEAVLQNDTRLHTPFQLADQKPYSIPHRGLSQCHASGWDVLTALRNYPYDESELILWEDEIVVAFPPGSTFFIPTGLISYSFTAVSDDSTHMILSQSLNGDLYDYVANGCQAHCGQLP
ncbi:hypothetical protein C8R44DRAFT_867165 [Mycena epipterygia]|nr:hypothetical protein C8R44DRAFT_867165 [Mycena epipterygia]